MQNAYGFCHERGIEETQGIGRLRDLARGEPVRRYGHDAPGDMIHLDIKKPGRFARPGHHVTGSYPGHPTSDGAGWAFVHVCTDNASRIAFSRIFPDEEKQSAVAFLEAALGYDASLGIAVQRHMTDNGACDKAHAFRDACRGHGPLAHPLQVLLAENQRQSRTRHPDRPPRMGIRASLKHL